MANIEKRVYANGITKEATPIGILANAKRSFISFVDNGLNATNPKKAVKRATINSRFQFAFLIDDCVLDLFPRQKNIVE